MARPAAHHLGQHARWRARDAGDVYDGGDDGATYGGDGVHLSSSSHNGNYGGRATQLSLTAAPSRAA